MLPQASLQTILMQTLPFISFLKILKLLPECMAMLLQKDFHLQKFPQVKLQLLYQLQKRELIVITSGMKQLLLGKQALMVYNPCL